MPRYDEQILLKGAVRLQAQARSIIFWTATKYTILTLLITSTAGAILHTHILSIDSIVSAVAILTVTAVMVGIFVGQDRAFELRLRAQQLVALLQIEHNTHQARLPS